ncbi:hypothetical protein SB860_35010, partial [Burkholderia sp. SIMBA_019]
WIMTVSRRINYPDGRFAGVALATIYLSHFLALYASIDMGQNGVINLIASQLKVRGVETVPFHGGIPITKRVADKDKRFVNGSATGLLCTKGSGRAGYNLPNA